MSEREKLASKIEDAYRISQEPSHFVNACGLFGSEWQLIVSALRASPDAPEAEPPETVAFRKRLADLSSRMLQSGDQGHDHRIHVTQLDAEDVFAASVAPYRTLSARPASEAQTIERLREALEPFVQYYEDICFNLRKQPFPESAAIEERGERHARVSWAAYRKLIAALAMSAADCAGGEQ